MLKWLIALIAAVFILGLLQPRLARMLRLGRLPGDVRLHLRGKDYVFPFASAALLSVLGSLIAHLL